MSLCLLLGDTDHLSAYFHQKQISYIAQVFQYTNSRWNPSMCSFLWTWQGVSGSGEMGRAGSADLTMGEMCPPLAVLYGLSCPLNEALVSPFSCWAAGLSEGLFVSVLLGMDLVIQKLLSQFISVINLQLHIDAKKGNKHAGEWNIVLQIFTLNINHIY